MNVNTTANHVRGQEESTQSSTSVVINGLNKIVYSTPGSPISENSPITSNEIPTNVNSSPASGATKNSTNSSDFTNLSLILSTPKNKYVDSYMLKTIREKLKTPGGACELNLMSLECSTEPVNVVKDRYLICTQPINPCTNPAKKPTSYRHLIDLTSSNLKCTDVFTEEEFLCKIINEPLNKVQNAYFQLQEDAEMCHSSIYGHSLIRAVHDIVPESKQKTYIIISRPEQQQGIYEDLHTYIRNKRRICETEARSLFHQICQTVLVCHRKGIVLRDLKLKRFYFIDEERTKLQYESLEGSMILDNPANDTLFDKIGCPLYTAPELLCPNPTYKGKPADIWSLGVILYTMLVGQYPFYEKGNCNLITIIRHCHVQVPSSLSKSLRWLLLTLLHKVHTERPSAEDIFYSPWLKELKPFYMYISTDVFIPDETMSKYETILMDVSDLPEPLDYTCNTLEMVQDNDHVEMG